MPAPPPKLDYAGPHAIGKRSQGCLARVVFFVIAPLFMYAVALVVNRMAAPDNDPWIVSSLFVSAGVVVVSYWVIFSLPQQREARARQRDRKAAYARPD